MTFYKILSDTKMGGYKTHVHHQHVRFHRNKKFKRSIVEIHSVYNSRKRAYEEQELGDRRIIK